MAPTSEVVVCTYNGSAYVVQQLSSIVEQTTTVNKISIYDDRSSDDTVSRIENFVSGLPLNKQRLFTIEINQKNLGYAQNFINAIGKATQDILFLCDQDDIWEPNKVEVLLALFSENGPDMVFSDGLLIDHAGRQLGQRSILASYGLSEQDILSFRNRAFERLMKRNYVPGAAAAIRRQAAQAAVPLPCDMPHDYWLAIWSSLHKGLVAVPETLYRYRQHQHNVIGGMGSNNLAYLFLGIWRQPSAPRERELRIWKAITSRISEFACQKRVEAARCKLNWLSRIVADDKRNIARAYEIVKSALNGSYHRYSPKYAFWRDMMSLIK